MWFTLHLELFAYKANRKVQTFFSRHWQRETWKTDAFLISWFSFSILHSPGQENLGQQIGHFIHLPLLSFANPVFPVESVLHISESSQPESTHFCLRKNGCNAFLQINLSFAPSHNKQQPSSFDYSKWTLKVIYYTFTYLCYKRYCG